MIPSLKAKILYNTFRELGASDYISKKCAIITVDEVIKFNSLPDHLLDFWLHVKIEIEKI